MLLVGAADFAALAEHYGLDENSAALQTIHP